MKILHVSMGLPPFRVGGLNEYCLELMEQQVIDGHNISLLYPAEMKFNKKVRVLKDRAYFLKCKGNIDLSIQTYKIENPLPLSLVFGINQPNRYMKTCDIGVYLRFLKDLDPDIIHIHCLQGIHKEFFEAAEVLRKKMVFTTHDYFPICPKCFLYSERMGLCKEVLPEKCASCNINSGLSKKHELIMQSSLYRRFKYSKLFKIIRTTNRRHVTLGETKEDLAKISIKLESIYIRKYEELSNYYKSIMGKIDVVHCNSYVSENIYKEYFPNLNYQVIPITRKYINRINRDKYIKRIKSSSKLIIGYVGGINPSKGLKTLIDAVLLLDALGTPNWELHLYGSDYVYEQIIDNRIISFGIFNNELREKVYSSFDILVVPSLCPETFGFVVLEALSVGTAVICSNLVGAQDYVKQLNDNNEDEIIQKNKYIFESGDSNELATKIISIYKERPSFIMDGIDTIDIHSKKIKKMIYD